MTRALLLLLALVAVVASGSAAAQPAGAITPISLDPVAFEFDPHAAPDPTCPGCRYLDPIAPTATVFEVQRRAPVFPYTIDAAIDGWSPASAMVLELRILVTDQAGNTALYSTPWLALGPGPLQLFTQADTGGANRVRVEVEYRLRVPDDAPAGDVETRVRFTLRQTGSSVGHDVAVRVPTFLLLRLVGPVGASSEHSLTFDYASSPAAYLAAVTADTPLPPTTSDLERVEVATNHPSGFTLRVTVEADPLWPGAEPSSGRLLLFDAPADGRTLVRDEPTDGFETVLRASDFGLRVDGLEAPGQYQLRVRYAVERNP